MTAVDLQTPSSVEISEAAFCAAIEAIDGIRAALDHEPEALPPRPCTTMLYVRVQQEDFATGPATDNTWEWRVNVYVDLGPGSGYREAQRLLKRLVPLVLRTVRTDQRLADTCIRAEFADVDEEPTFDHDNGLIWKSLRLRVLLEET